MLEKKDKKVDRSLLKKREEREMTGWGAAGGEERDERSSICQSRSSTYVFSCWHFLQVL